VSRLKLAWNSLSGASLFFTDASVSLVMTPIIVAQLGRRDYGLWELMLSVVGYLGILDLGMGPAVIRHVAHAQAKENPEELTRVFNTGIVALCGAGVLGAAIIGILALWGSSILGLRPNEVPYLGILFGLFAVHLVLGFFLSSVVAFVMGLQYHRLINTVRMCTTVLQAFLVYTVLTSGREPALIYMSLAVLSINTLQATLFITWILRRSPVRLDFSVVSLQTARELLTFGLKSTLLMAAATLVKRAALFVTAHVVGVAAIAYFVIPNRLAEYAQALGLALGFPLTPYFTSLASGSGGIESARAAWLPITRALQLVALGMPVAVMWLGEAFLRRWMGAEYADHGRVVLYVLCSALMVQGVACNANRLLMSLGKHGRVALLAAVLAPVAVIASIFLGRQWGIVGIAAAVAGYAALQAVGELYFACRELQMPIASHLRGTAARYLLPLSICSLAFFLMRRIEVPSTYLAILSQGIAAGVLYLAAAFVFALQPDERRSIIAWVGQRARRQSKGTA
jgi:O-antigen/teichoic acid export membrane protein